MITQVGAVEPALDMVNIFGPWGPLAPPFSFGGSTASVVFEGAGRTVWFSMYIPTTCTVKRFWWVNGTTVSAANTVKMALYSSSGYKPGSKLGTEASTTQGTLSQVQFSAPTSGDFTVGPGPYWLALYCSATSSHFIRQQVHNASIKFQQTAVPPATATPVESADPNWYVCGFSTTTLT